MLDGIFIQAAGNTIGGTTPAARNTVAFNSMGGIRVDGGSGNLIRQNSIHTNADLGLILTNGANNNQMAPSVNSATSNTGGTTVSVSLALSAPDTVFTIDFFSSNLCDPSTFGEGEVYLGSKTLTTKVTGRGRTIFVTGVEVPAGHVITATATSPGNDTSKFSKCRTVTASTAPGPNGDSDGLHFGIVTISEPDSMQVANETIKPANAGFTLDGTGSERLTLSDTHEPRDPAPAASYSRPATTPKLSLLALALDGLQELNAEFVV